MAKFRIKSRRKNQLMTANFTIFVCSDGEPLLHITCVRFCLQGLEEAQQLFSSYTSEKPKFCSGKQHSPFSQLSKFSWKHTKPSCECVFVKQSKAGLKAGREGCREQDEWPKNHCNLLPGWLHPGIPSPGETPTGGCKTAFLWPISHYHDSHSRGKLSSWVEELNPETGKQVWCWLQ